MKAFVGVLLSHPSSPPLPPGIDIVLGRVSKHKVPLFGQDRPWEPRLDNGYANVAYDPSDPHGRWRLWYGGCIGPDDALCATQTLSYARSDDGLVWEKPSLGAFDLSSALLRPKISVRVARAGKQIKTRNNIILQCAGCGVLKSEGRFQAVGVFHDCDDVENPMPGRDGARCIFGRATSTDGLSWSNPVTMNFATPHAWDCHNTLFRIAPQRYLVTTRNWLKPDPGRVVSMALSGPGGFEDWGTTIPAVEMARGTVSHQLYSMVPFMWRQLYLALVMVYDARQPREVGTISCKLAWAPAWHGPWRSVGSWADGPEVIPRGKAGSFDSHIIFAAAHPVRLETGEVRLYYMGGNGPHNGQRNTSLGLASMAADTWLGVGGSGAWNSTQTQLLTCTSTL